MTKPVRLNEKQTKKEKRVEADVIRFYTHTHTKHEEVHNTHTQWLGLQPEQFAFLLHWCVNETAQIYRRKLSHEFMTAALYWLNWICPALHNPASTIKKWSSSHTWNKNLWPWRCKLKIRSFSQNNYFNSWQLWKNMKMDIFNHTASRIHSVADAFV